MVKIRISYDNTKELNKVMKHLLPVVARYKKVSTGTGKHKRVYVETNIDIKG